MLSILKIQGHPRTQNILSFIIMTGDTSKQILYQQDSPLKCLLVMSYLIYTSPNALLKPVFFRGLIKGALLSIVLGHCEA